MQRRPGQATCVRGPRPVQAQLCALGQAHVRRAPAAARATCPRTGACDRWRRPQRAGEYGTGAGPQQQHPWLHVVPVGVGLVARTGLSSRLRRGRAGRAAPWGSVSFTADTTPQAFALGLWYSWRTRSQLWHRLRDDRRGCTPRELVDLGELQRSRYNRRQSIL